MHNVTDLNGLIALLEQAKELQAAHGNVPVSLKLLRESDSNPFGSFYEERELSSSLAFIDQTDPPAIELLVT